MQANQPRRLIPKIGNWQEMRAAFQWNVPEIFNISERCCDSWALQEPGKTALIHVPETGDVQNWSYGQLKEASDRFANVLAARGIGQSDRVAVLLAQCPEVMITHFAVMKLGAVVLPLFTLFGVDALRYRLKDSGAKAVISDAENVEKLIEIWPDLPKLASLFSIAPATQPVRNFWQDIKTANSNLTPLQTRADDPAVLIYTSGTTGPPKGVLHAHRFLLGHLPAIECHHEGFPQPQDIGWTPADWAWIGGLMDMAMPCLYYGVPLVSCRMRRFDPDAAFALIKRHRARNLFLPPTALKLMRQAVVPKGLNIRSVSSGGESLGADLLDWGREDLGAPINEIYGQTECNLVLSSCAGSMQLRSGSMGQAVPGFEVDIIDDLGQPLPTGELGEIAIKAPNPAMFLHYLNKPKETAAKYINGWLRTGDLGTRDRDGYFTFASRNDDIISSAGYRIGPSEIENCLNSHPDVVMSAAIGVPDTIRGEIVKAYVVLRQGADSNDLAQNLIAQVKKQISPHVAPKTIEMVKELPMTATGKIMRRKLRE